MKILDLGCATRKWKGDLNDIIVGVDITTEGTLADIEHDLNKFPYPFKNNEFDLVICSHILEHLWDTGNVMAELWRITKPRGIIKIWTPAWTDTDSYTDPTHVHHFTLESFDYWIPISEFFAQAITRKVNVAFKIGRRDLIFGRNMKKIGINWFANKYYEFYKHKLCWILPCRELYFELEVLK